MSLNALLLAQAAHAAVGAAALGTQAAKPCLVCRARVQCSQRGPRFDISRARGPASIENGRSGFGDMSSPSMTLEKWSWFLVQVQNEERRLSRIAFVLCTAVEMPRVALGALGLGTALVFLTCRSCQLVPFETYKACV